MDDIYRKLAGNICSQKGQCVLILGPELSVDQNGKEYKTYFREITQETESRYFDSENLFYFKNEYERDHIRDKVTNFYKQAGDPVLMEMISRIPFPLIINVCPDKALNNVYNEKKIDLAEGYFTKNSKTEFNPLIPLPSRKNPVIYNIFGSIDLEKSLILTHNKLYETMEHLLPEKSLPDNIEQFLTDTANSFIFLGFKFDSWQYQLVCHKLKIKDEKTNVCTPFFGENDNVSIIMTSSFNMKSTQDNAFQCVQKLINVCESNFPGNIRPKNINGAYSVFVSYGWKDEFNLERENVVDLIQAKLLNDKTGLFQFFRDRNEQSFGDSIDSFMTRIGTGKTVVRVISHKYLTSVYCMIESFLISKHKDPEQRVFNIIMEDADINNLSKYKDYWFEELQNQFKDRTKLDKGYYDHYANIYRFIDDFLPNLSDKIHLRLKYSDVVIKQGEIIIVEEKKAAFDEFMKNLNTKMKQN